MLRAGVSYPTGVLSRPAWRERHAYQTGPETTPSPAYALFGGISLSSLPRFCANLSKRPDLSGPLFLPLYKEHLLGTQGQTISPNSLTLLSLYPVLPAGDFGFYCPDPSEMFRAGQEELPEALTD